MTNHSHSQYRSYFKIRVVAQLSLALLFLTGTHAQLQLYKTGEKTTLVSTLAENQSICTADFPTGFTIGCVATDTDNRAIFRVNGIKVHTEFRKPFFIAGDTGGLAHRWKIFPTTAVISCVLESNIFSARVSFDCGSSPVPTHQLSIPPNDSQTGAPNTSQTKHGHPSHPPGTIVAVPPGQPSRRFVVLTDGATICPERQLKSESFTIVCTGSGKSKRAIFRRKGKILQKVFNAPFSIAGQSSDGSLKAWTEVPTGRFGISCSLNDGIRKKVRRVRVACPDGAEPIKPKSGDNGKNSVPPPVSDSVSEGPVDFTAAPLEITEGGCLLLQAQDTQLSKGWEADVTDGVTFQPNNRSTKIRKGGETPLYYRFMSPRTTRYGLSIDMTTRGRADYNDLYIRMEPGGLQLMRDGIGYVVKRWIKGYHSLLGRGFKVVSVDHHAHSVSSGVILQEGLKYTFAISGRSNRVTVHRILLIPCESVGCQRKQWKDRQELCVPGSTDFAAVRHN